MPESVRRPRRALLRASWTTPTPGLLAGAVVLLAIVDFFSQRAGDSVFPGGPLDETAHLLTTLVVLWALGPRVTRHYAAPALLASVLIDIDHIPQHLGTHFLTSGTPRPYTHSLLTLAVALLGAAAWPKRRRVLIGVALGLAIHFARDVGEGPGSGVPLLWPVSNAAASSAHWVYLVAMAGIVAVCVQRASRRAGQAHGQTSRVPSGS